MKQLNHLLTQLLDDVRPGEGQVVPLFGVEADVEQMLLQFRPLLVEHLMMRNDVEQSVDVSNLNRAQADVSPTWPIRPVSIFAVESRRRRPHVESSPDHAKVLHESALFCLLYVSISGSRLRLRLLLLLLWAFSTLVGFFQILNVILSRVSF